jgi:hypothetical protein
MMLTPWPRSSVTYRPRAHVGEQLVEAAGVRRHLQVVHAAGVAGGRQAQLARRVAAEHVALDDAVDHQRVGAGATPSSS